jgi:osmotically-inducible protein OsmY
MRMLFALVLGMAIGAAALWFYTKYRHDVRLQSAGQKVENAARLAHDIATNEMRLLHVRPEDIKEELARTGQVVRRTATEAGHAIADAAADARITGAIKAKLVASRDLSALNISVNTTDGVVTLSGSVSSSEDIGKAIVLAMQTDGVREVVSTLQVRPKGK